MATSVQLRRGTTTQNNAFTGALGEISVDQTLDTIRVHDGSTAGGFEMTQNAAVQTLTNKTIVLGNNTVSGTGAIGFGNCLTSNNDYSIAVGWCSNANGVISTAIGFCSCAITSHTLAVGKDVHATGLYSSAFGNNSVSSGSRASSVGRGNIASGENSSAFGYFATSSIMLL